MEQGFNPNSKISAEEREAWRKQNAEKLNPENEFMTMPDGSVMEANKKSPEELREELNKAKE